MTAAELDSDAGMVGLYLSACRAGVVDRGRIDLGAFCAAWAHARRVATGSGGPVALFVSNVRAPGGGRWFAAEEDSEAGRRRADGGVRQLMEDVELMGAAVRAVLRVGVPGAGAVPGAVPGGDEAVRASVRTWLERNGRPVMTVRRYSAALEVVRGWLGGSEKW